jgi:hypothetical protein
VLTAAGHVAFATVARRYRVPGLLPSKETTMVKHDYWQEKRLDRTHVLSAWVLVLILLVMGLGFTN